MNTIRYSLKHVFARDMALKMNYGSSFDLIKLKQQYKYDLQSRVQSYSEKMKERDKETKVVLSFLKQT